MVKIAWNKGLTKSTDKRVLQYALKGLLSRKGQTPWNTGKVWSKEHRKIMSDARLKGIAEGRIKPWNKKPDNYCLNCGVIISKKGKRCKRCNNIEKSNKNNVFYNNFLIKNSSIICKKCLINKNISEFYFRKDTNKYRLICKECNKKRIKQYAIKNSEHIKQYQKKYFNKHKEKLSKNHKEYFQRTYVHKGYHVNGFKKGHVPWHKGKTGIYSDETLEKMSKAKRGFRYCNRKGFFALRKVIRELFEYKQWRKAVFERDKYTCQNCSDSSGGNLEAHHKKTLGLLLNTFLREYDQFSPIDDIETLARLAMKWDPFWDINNGQTLCKECHKLTRSYYK